MKNALLLLTIWLGILFAAYMMVYWDGGAESPIPTLLPEPTDAVYIDSAGRFGLVFPSTWTIDETDSSVLLSGPDGRIEIEITSVDEPVPEAALLDALGIIEADEKPDALAVEEIETSADVVRGVRLAAATREEKAGYGLAYLLESETLLVLVSGDEQALEARAEELKKIEAGIVIPASEMAAPEPAIDPVVEL